MSNSRFSSDTAVRGGCAVLTTHGRLDRGARYALRAQILGELADSPRGLVCDLTDSTDLDPSCLAALVGLAGQAAEWPGIPLVPASSDSALLEYMGEVVAGDRPSVQPTMVAAVDSACPRAPLPVASIDLSPDPSAPAIARRFITSVCVDPDDAELAWVACVVASDLVTNALTYAATPMQLRVASHPGLLRMSVREAGDAASHALDNQLDADHGHGLLLVDRLTRCWGTIPTHSHGNVVWCVIDALHPTASAPADSPVTTRAAAAR
ncbi:MAG: hypothetical protein ACRDYU_15755 [Actinomycetes bacterium]